jgi:cholinesterase
MKLQVYTLIIIGAAYALALQPNWKIGQQVNTSSGKVIGGRASTGSEVSGYFGIPYAKPPVGDLRFAPPERFSRNSIIDAKSFVFHPCFAMVLSNEI